MAVSAAPIIAAGVPLVGALAIVLARRRPNLREGVTFATGLALLAATVSMWPAVAAGERPLFVAFDISPALRLAFEVEPLGLLFATLASVLWITTSLFSVGYMRALGEHAQTRFYACFALSLAATTGVAFAANLFTLFVFYEVLTLATWPLVTHHEDGKARRGGRVYALLLLGASIAFLLPAIVWTQSLAGTLAFEPGGVLAGRVSPGAAGLLLALYVFGIAKAAIMPLHRWLPAAMVAPTPVSALLHAVAVVKAGVFSILKVAVYIFGPDMLAEASATRWLMYLAALGLVIAAVVAGRQDNLKARLAWSTVSQLSYVTLGALMANAPATLGAGLHIVMHAAAKITLFFCAGAILVASGKTRVSELGGIGRRMPITMGAFAVASLGVVGLPPAGGMWSKWQLALGTLEAGEGVLLAALLIGSILSFAYLAPICVNAFCRAPASPSDGAIREAPWPCTAAIVICALLVLWSFTAPDLLHRVLEPLVSGGGAGATQGASS